MGRESHPVKFECNELNWQYLHLKINSCNTKSDKIPKFLAHSLKLELSLTLKSLHLKGLAEATLRSVLNTL